MKKKLVFIFLLLVNLLQAQKIEVGFMLSPQIFSVNFNEPQKSVPLFAGVWVHLNKNKFTALAYDAENKNIFSVFGIKDYYLINGFNLAKNPNYTGIGKIFEIEKITPVIFTEIGTNYSFKEKNNFPIILSTGVFIPFRKLIYEKTKRSPS